MLLAIPVILNSYYEQRMFKAMLLFAFSTFARIGELVAMRDIPQEHILQLSDVSLTSVQGEIKEAVVSFNKFKHSIKEGAKVVRFTDENTNSSEPAIKCLVNFLQLRPKLPGPLFCLVTGQPVARSYFDKILHKYLDFFQLDSSKYKGHTFASALPQQQRREVGLILELEKQVVGSPMLLENTYGPKLFMLVWFLN